jgi:hypothetical protein
MNYPQDGRCMEKMAEETWQVREAGERYETVWLMASGIKLGLRAIFGDDPQVHC